MAAGLGFKTFTTGEVLTAADTNGYLMQGVLVFASAAARDAAITSPQEGQFAYLKDTNVTTYYTGSAWANLDTTGMTNPMTTTGDTIYSSSGSTPARLGIGSTSQVLTVAGGVPSWATPAAGGGMTLLSTTTLSGSTTTISSISGAYKNLQIIMRNPTWATGVAKIRLAIDGTLTFKTSGVISWGSGASKDTMVFYSTVQNPMQDTSSNTTGTDNLVWNIYDYAQTTAFKPIDIKWTNATQAYIAGGCIATNGAVSQIQIINDQSYAFDGGSVLIYGVN